MEIEREIPESHITCIADQFADTVDILRAAMPQKIVPHALRVNAAFSIELYLKSLNCRWIHHNQIETLGVDCDAITIQPDKHGHKLDVLFDALDTNAQNYLATEFMKYPLVSSYCGLRAMLAEYSDIFVSDRYIFERLYENGSHPISEIVELVRFFRNTINSLEKVRVG